MKSKYLFHLALASLVLAASPTLGQPEDSPDVSRLQDQGTVIEKLREIVALRANLLEGQRPLVDAGRLSTIDLAKFEIALIESEIELASAEGKSEMVSQRLRDLVDVYERKWETLKTQHEAGGAGVGRTDVAEARIDLLKAEIRLLHVVKD